MKNNIVLRGAGGSKAGGAHVAVEATDSLRSKMFARVLDVVSEGELEGFIDPNGHLLTNAYLSTLPTITDGVIQNDAVLASGGSGYSAIENGTGNVVYSGTFTFNIIDPRTTYDGSAYGKGAGKNGKGRVTISNGVVTSFEIIAGGENYSSETKVQVPYSIGKAILIDDHQLQEYDQSYNHNFVTVEYRNGSQSQPPINGYNVAEQTVSVPDGEVSQHGGEKSVTVNSDSADIIIVGITLNSLFRQDKSTGDIKGTSISYSISLKVDATDPHGDSVTIFPKQVVTTDTISGKTSSTYSTEKAIPLSYVKDQLDFGYHGFIYTITVARLTEDRDLSYSDKITFGYVNMVTSLRLSYPNSAYVGIQLDAQNFNTIPRRAYRMRLLKIKVPTNYFPLTRQYNRTRFGVAAAEDVTEPIEGTVLGDDLRFVFPSVSTKTYELIEEDDFGVETVVYAVTGTDADITYDYADKAGSTLNYYLRSYILGSQSFAAGSAVVDSTGSAVNQVWDGSFYTVWSNNPAWVFYDLATNTRYGAGHYLTGLNGNIDKWALYKIARYCDEQVPSGYGKSYEPRFTCNMYLSGNPEDAYRVLTNLASVFRGMMYWAGGSIVPVQDSYTDPDSSTIMAFTQSNVKDGMFNYSGTSRKARHTAAAVTWNDPANFYKQAVEYVEDPEGILLYGLRIADVNSVGCTSRGQARRIGKWLLYTEINETETVTFRTGLEAAFLRPFGIVKVFDTVKAGMLYAGRIASISDDRKTIITDVKTTLNPAAYGTGYTLVVANPSPFIPENEIASEEDLRSYQASQILNVAVTGITGDVSNPITLSLVTALPDSVLVGSVWGIQSSALAPRAYRILSIQEVEHNEFEVTASYYNKGKYDSIERGYSFTEPNYSTLNLNPLAPTSLVLTELSIFTLLGTPAYKIDVSWSPALGVPVKEFVLLWRFGEGNFQPLVTTSANQYEVEVNQAGTYSFRVYAVGISGARSTAYIERSLIVGKDTLLGQEDPNSNKVERISGLELFGQGNDATFYERDVHLEWRLNSPLNSYDIGSEPNGANSGRMSDNFACYRVRIFDPNLTDNPETSAVENLIHDTTTNEPRFVFTHAMNVQLAQNRLAAPGVPYRELLFEVTNKNIQNSYSFPNLLHVTNPLPSAINETQVSIAQAGAGKPLFFTMPLVTDPDFAGYRVWYSTVSGFSPDDKPAYEGRANPIILTLPAGVTYFKFAAYDSFSETALDCNLSGQKSFTVA